MIADSHRVHASFVAAHGGHSTRAICEASFSLKYFAERALAVTGFRLERTEKPLDHLQEKFGQLILDDQRRRAGKDFFFVQIGACDGVSFDALYDFVVRYRLRGIVVEPLPDLYAELVANYCRLPLVVPLNVGIHRTARQVEMYRASATAPGVPAWAKGSSSMDPEHYKRAKISPDAIISEKVNCISWKELVDQHHITRIDYLQLDTEGYDYEILHMLDFDNLRPSVIKFEHDVLSGTMSVEQLNDCISMLVNRRYHILTMSCDTIAYSSLETIPNE